MPSPTNEEVYRMARRVARYLSTGTRQSGSEYFKVYEDDNLRATAPIGGTGVCVSLLRPDERPQQVYIGQDDTKRNPHRLNPGRWLDRLQELDERARAVEERHHTAQHEENVPPPPRALRYSG